ncbi:MAG TPA: hypothetical protein VI756_29790 [Blastocatellia bacterium]
MEEPRDSLGRLVNVGIISTMFFVSLTVASSPSPHAQDQQMRDVGKEWAAKRPENDSDKSTVLHPAYIIKTQIPKSLDTPNLEADPRIGVTVWRLRPSTASDQARSVIKVGDTGRQEKWTAERVESSALLLNGQMVRLTIESTRTGYLYIIDREKYADGTFGVPYLIFPAADLDNGTNLVRAGRLVQIPEPDSDQPYFKLAPNKRTRGTKQEGEELLVIVATQPLAGLQTAIDRAKLSAKTVDELIQRYTKPIEVAEMKHGAGAAETSAEQRAASDPQRLLRSDDPFPETIYRIAASPDDPMLVTVDLKVADARDSSAQAPSVR